MAENKRTVDIHGKEYETVASRVERFRNSNLASTIKTEIIKVTKHRVIMKATIGKYVEIESSDGTELGVQRQIQFQILATGHAEEVRAASTINKTSALENCETSAIGRALAAFGLAGTEFASADEVANAIKQQNESKVDDPKHWTNKKPFPAQPDDKPATDKQKQTLVAKSMEWSTVDMMPKDALKAMVEYAGSFGIEWANMTNADYQKLFKELKDDWAETSADNEASKEPE